MRVSVIIPTYNYGHFLGECLESVLLQSAPADEIVVVDDGSTDDTPEVIRPFLLNASVEYIRTENQGVAAARNTAIQASTGDIIGLLDSDDIWRPDKLERQLPLFRDPHVGVVYSLHQRFGPDGPTGDYRRGAPRGRILNELMKDNPVPLSSALVRRSCFGTAGLFDDAFSICADYEMWVRMALHGVEFDYVDEALLLYRTSHASLLSDTSGQNRENRRVLEQVFAGLGREACTPAMQRTAWAFFYARCAYGHFERGHRWRAIADAARSIYHRRRGVMNDLAWRTLVKSLLPASVVNGLKALRR